MFRFIFYFSQNQSEQRTNCHFEYTSNKWSYTCRGRLPTQLLKTIKIIRKLFLLTSGQRCATLDILNTSAHFVHFVDSENRAMSL